MICHFGFCAEDAIWIVKDGLCTTYLCGDHFSEHMRKERKRGRNPIVKSINNPVKEKVIFN